MLQFSDLPPDIVMRALLWVDTLDLISLSLTNRSLNWAIINSHALQFRLAAHRAGVDVNTRTRHLACERLSLLNRLEHGCTCGLEDFTGGFCVLGDDDNRELLHYFKMPSRREDEVEWKTIDVGSHVVGFGLSHYEHDLIAVLTSDPRSIRPYVNIVQMHLIQFSTGKPHPLAQQPVLTVEESALTHAPTVIGVVGDHLVAILGGSSYDRSVHDRFYILEWKTGIVKLVRLSNGLHELVV
ncbi:hypothetical protein H0H92_001725 [Tricholoma furcatifolium]|nr:hypothetical protein H0H92_001725 [Tricholoma furcatifolium]